MKCLHTRITCKHACILCITHQRLCIFMYISSMRMNMYAYSCIMCAYVCIFLHSSSIPMNIYEYSYIIHNQNQYSCQKLQLPEAILFLGKSLQGHQIHLKLLMVDIQHLNHHNLYIILHR